MATYKCVVEPFARVFVTFVDELKAYPQEKAAALAAEVLTPGELAAWESMPAQQTRRMEWLLGRVALKEAVCDWLLETQLRTVASTDVVITRTEAGAPQVEWASDDDGVLPVVSLAHATGVIVAAVAGATSVGVDVECADRRATTIARVLTDVESELFAADQISLLSAVVAKEAASKAVGLGLGGDLRRWPIIHGDQRQHIVTCVDDPDLRLLVELLPVPKLVLGVCVVI
jgi:phosphopantetheinyl transferase (holo-ACP synthase)